MMTAISIVESLKATTIQQRRTILASLGVALGIALALILRIAFSSVASSAHGGTRANRVVEATEVVCRHLDWADRESTLGLDPYLNEVHQFFELARSRSRLFAADALGWDSKLKLTTDFFSGNNNHSAFLRERFSENLFSPEELEQLMERLIGSYVRRLGDIESQMLVGMEADLAALPSSGLTLEIDREALNQSLRAALEASAQAAAGDFRGMIVQEMVSMVAGEILAHVATQLAVSAGILSVGAASGWKTFGIGVVVGLIVDAIVAELYNEAFDPSGQLASKVNENLNEMERLILEGSPQSPGMKGRLQNYSIRRNEERRRAIEQVVLTNMAL